jgi:nicotinamidase-related amidase
MTDIPGGSEPGGARSARHPDLLVRDDSILLLVDLQERLLPIVEGRAALVAKIATLARGAALLAVPTLVSEQYPQGLGRTVAPVLEAAPGAAVFAKTSFSCGADGAIVSALRRLDRGSVVLAGVEAHVCVLQTALDLLARGWRVHVVADAVGTRDPRNLAVGRQRAARAGATITSVESVLFEWLGRSDVPEFRSVQALLK